MQCIFKAKNFILIQPDTRNLHLRSADETLVHFVVVLLHILGIDIDHKITKVSRCSKNKGWFLQVFRKEISSIEQ
jgi:hypothetical protein